MSLQLSGNSKFTAGATFTASDKLIDAVADSPITGNGILFTIDDSSVPSVPSVPYSVITDSKGKFTAQLTAPAAPGKHNVQGNFAGGSKYNPSDSSVSSITVEAVTTQNQKKTVTTHEEQTEEATEEQTEEETEEPEEETK
jgi:hypothetical protein